jgi:hypothetical protein
MSLCVLLWFVLNLKLVDECSSVFPGNNLFKLLVKLFLVEFKNGVVCQNFSPKVCDNDFRTITTTHDKKRDKQNDRKIKGVKQQ